MCKRKSFDSDQRFHLSRLYVRAERINVVGCTSVSVATFGNQASLPIRTKKDDVDRYRAPSPGARRVLRMAFLIAITLEDIVSLSLSLSNEATAPPTLIRDRPRYLRSRRLRRSRRSRSI